LGEGVLSVGKDEQMFLDDCLNTVKQSYEIMMRNEARIYDGGMPDTHVLVIDEIRDILDSKQHPSISKEIMGYLDEIARKGRSSSVHLILATQAPRASFMDQLRANMTIFALKVANSTEAKVSGYNNLALNLLGKGDGLITENGTVYRVQSPI
jgi:DNA segregation ATPase FtsK/SpoIIIE-like protein